MARYIDINEIKFTGAVFEDRDGEIYIKLSDVKQSIEQTPTADVVEVRHGKWESFEIPHMVRCSECGVSDLDIHRTKFVFCPYCSARMDGTPKERGGEK